MSKHYTDTETVEILTGEGHDTDTILAYIDQIVDAGLEYPDQPDEGVILTAGEVDVIRDQFELVAAASDEEEANLADACEALAAAEHEVDEARTRRDAQIRRALAYGIPYHQVGEITGLTRQHLDRIRRAVN